MNIKVLFIIGAVFLLLIAFVSAADNTTDDTVSLSDDRDTLEKTYYYDEYGDEYEDDTVITHNVVKYYGDTDTKFKVKVYDDDYNPMEGVYVSFGKSLGKMKEKTTNSKGIVYFPINYKPGKYYVETQIDSEDGESYWSAENTVTVKSTIVTKELVKYSNQKNKKFKIKFVDSKGVKLTATKVKITVKGKTYKLKTDSKGYVRVKLNSLKVGKYKISAYNPVTGEKRKIKVVILKKGVHKFSIRIDDPTDIFPTKKLKNGDHACTVYETKYAQYYPGVYVQTYNQGLDYPKHTKLIKAKFYFKNKKTGKIITKTSSKVLSKTTLMVKPIKGYSPYKATVWYKDKV